MHHTNESLAQIINSDKSETNVKTLKQRWSKTKQGGESGYVALRDWRNTPPEGMSTGRVQQLMGRRCKSADLQMRYQKLCTTLARALLGRTVCIVNTAAGMASSGDFYTIKLPENEVSGAVLLHSDVSQNSVISLRRLRECRGFLTKGNKTELVKMSVRHQPGDGFCSSLSISFTFR